jgi:choice-of-anchor A domain-containing protein
MGGGDTIKFATGANLVVYSGGTSCTVNTQVAFNSPGYAANFILYCAPSVTSFTMNGNATFVGVVVAPNADVTLNGSGDPAHPTDFIGCLMANTVTLNGHFNFHYDEALGGNPSFGRFLITSWNELR